jgi:hypothetical protein
MMNFETNAKESSVNLQIGFETINCAGIFNLETNSVQFHSFEITCKDWQVGVLPWNS